MKKHLPISREPAHEVDRNIGLAFDVRRDIIADPAIVEDIPTDSVVSLETISLHGDRFRIAAHRPTGSADEWIARVVHYGAPHHAQHRHDE